MTFRDILETLSDETLISAYVPENDVRSYKFIPVITSSTRKEIINTISLYLNLDLFDLEVTEIKTRSMGPNNCGSELMVKLEEWKIKPEPV